MLTDQQLEAIDKRIEKSATIAVCSFQAATQADEDRVILRNEVKWLKERLAAMQEREKNQVDKICDLVAKINELKGKNNG